MAGATADAAGPTVKLDLDEGVPHGFPGQLPDAPESMLAPKSMHAFLLAPLGK